MSTPKSFHSLLREWRERAEEIEPEATLDSYCAGRRDRLRICADEAQPILDKLREEVEKMEHEQFTGAYITGHASDCCRCRLERTLGEREK